MSKCLELDIPKILKRGDFVREFLKVVNHDLVLVILWLPYGCQDVLDSCFHWCINL